MSERTGASAVSSADADANADEVTLETGFEALRASPSFRGPAEPLEDHEHEHANDHFALIHESEAEQFAAAMPFVRQGLERDERCLYITHDHTAAEIEAAMRADGIDVDVALESGQLSIHDGDETYLRNGTFSADETIEFLDAAIAEATEEYEALRVTGEMSSVLREDPAGEELVECEAKANYLFDDVDGIALCQYDRNRFPADVIRDVISTHPILVQDDRVSYNVYYTPPGEFFGPEKSTREVDRLMGSLRDQTDTKVELQRRERFLRESYRITSDPDLEFESKLERLLDLAREWMGLEAAGVTNLPSWDDRFHNEYTVGNGWGGPDDELWTDPNEGCYCRKAISADEPVGMTDVRGTEWENDPIYRNYGLTCYLGTKITDGDRPYGTLWVGDTGPRDRPFTDTERTFLELLGRWVSYEIERKHREEALERSNERLEQFAYAASHDLQEPLRMVSSYLQLLEGRYGDDLEGDGEEFLEFAVDGADRMREMIDGLLEYSRVETQGEPLEPVDLDDVLEDVLADLQLQIEETDAEITVDSLPRVEGDRSQLRQVLQNLFDNAITYSGDDPPRIHVDATRRREEWVVSVHDDGIGIDPEEQERVFTVFDRLHGRDEYEGTGIGLALCRRVLERHGGDIWVDSEQGEGSTFSFTLPAADV
ncbi:histidine kinase [Halobiforma lacisalsi AJ5]|uniref:histidine kinase n=1 Tax=Natronobacterium lacisalsi AJ5 TaxID=358396 RepID=M0LS53_NATLA|nr:MEDS domain-containing protein [Halobiforma lacisalsi]APW96860.1 histidine kinase [Halobiforma lacisalsi AJ5]EMA34890.1 GAF sensor signal transduction histidine kinase [Halobiforma lacisalsi AJ5]